MPQEASRNQERPKREDRRQRDKQTAISSCEFACTIFASLLHARSAISTTTNHVPQVRHTMRTVSDSDKCKEFRRHSFMHFDNSGTAPNYLPAGGKRCLRRRQQHSKPRLPASLRRGFHRRPPTPLWSPE